MDSSINLRYAENITYAVLQSCKVLSLIAYTIVGCYFLSSLKDLKKTLSLHAYFIIFIMNFIQVSYDLALTLQYLATGIIRPSTYANCVIWIFIDSITYYSSLLLMAWVTFERHFLIFNPNIFNTTRRRIWFHCLPMVGICFFVSCYYATVDFLYPCENTFDFSLFFCGFVCYMNLPTPSLYSVELFLHQVIPTILIALFSIALVVHVVIARRKLYQSIEWLKYRKMITQSIIISIMYMIFTTPFSINPLVQSAGLPMPFPYFFYANVFTYWAYGVCITFPFILCFSLPNMVKVLKLPFTSRSFRRIGLNTA